MDIQKRPLREVRIEDFDTDLLRRAAREGRLFIALEDPTPGEQAPCSHQQLVDSILAYVQPIASYATTPRVDDLWKAVLHDRRLAPLFFFTRYSRTRGKVNWYRVTALVCLMRECGIYRQDVSAIRLHCILEGTKQRTNRYTGMNRYLFERADIEAFRKLAKKEVGL